MTIEASDHPETDRFPDWSRRLRRSDREAFAELFEAMHGPLIRYAIQLTNDEAQAYDVVQDAFLKLWAMRTKVDAGRSLKALLYTMVRNRSLNHLRLVQTRQSKIEAMSTMDSPPPVQADERIDADALARRIRKWINELPPKRREAFELSRFDGLSHAEIAEVMGITPRTVTNHIMMALQHVRDRFKNFQAEGGR